MKLKSLLLAGTSMTAVLAMTEPAHAFAAIGSLVISAFLAVGAGGLLPVASAAAIGLATVGIAATAGQLALQAALFGRQPSVDPNEIKNTTQGAEGPGRYAFGRVRLAGRVYFGNTAGYNIFRALLCCFGPISAVEEFFYDKLSVTVDPNGDVTSPPWAHGGGTNLAIKVKNGTSPETAFPDLVSHFPTLITEDFKAEGIAKVLIKALNPGTGHDRFLRLFQGGIKSVEVLARVGEFYDPRDASTEWSINGGLHVLHWWRRLPGQKDARIDFDNIGAPGGVLDQADALVPTLTGTAARCQLSGGWEGPLTQDVVEDMLTSAGLEVREVDGDKRTLAFIEDWPEPEITFLNRHIIDRFPQAGPEGAKRPNTCKLRYFSPERGFEMAEIDLSAAPWAKVESEIEIYGEQEFPVDLIFCCDASQAQRIARRLFHMERADFGVFKTTMAGIAKWGNKTALIEIPDVGEDGGSIMQRVRMDTARVNDEEGTVEIPYKVIPDELSVPWDPETMEVPAPPLLPEFQYESSIAKPVILAAALVQYPAGGFEVRVQFDHPAGGSTAEANYRTFPGGLPDPWQPMMEWSDGDAGDPPDVPVRPGTVWFGRATTADLTGEKIEYRVRWFNSDGDASYFSDPTVLDPAAIDNTAPTAAPGTFGVPNPIGEPNYYFGTKEIQVVKIVRQRREREEILPGVYGPWGPWADHASHDTVLPGIDASSIIGFPPGGTGGTYEYRYACATSNDTRGPYWYP